MQNEPFWRAKGLLLFYDAKIAVFLSENRCFLSGYSPLIFPTIPACYFSNESMRVFAAASDGRGA